MQRLCSPPSTYRELEKRGPRLWSWAVPYAQRKQEAHGAACGGEVGEGRERGGQEQALHRVAWGWGGGRGYSESDVLPNAGILAFPGRSWVPLTQPQSTLSEGVQTHPSKGQGESWLP